MLEFTEINVVLAIHTYPQHRISEQRVPLAASVAPHSLAKVRGRSSADRRRTRSGAQSPPLTPACVTRAASRPLVSTGSRARTYEERGRHHPPSGEGGEWKGGKGEPQEPSCRALPWSDLRGTETRRPTTPQPRKREPFRRRARIVNIPTEALPRHTNGGVASTYQR